MLLYHIVLVCAKYIEKNRDFCVVSQLKSIRINKKV
jgi:hypothetical protein